MGAACWAWGAAAAKTAQSARTKICKYSRHRVNSKRIYIKREGDQDNSPVSWLMICSRVKIHRIACRAFIGRQVVTSYLHSTAAGRIFIFMPPWERRKRRRRRRWDALEKERDINSTTTYTKIRQDPTKLLVLASFLSAAAPTAAGLLLREASSQPASQLTVSRTHPLSLSARFIHHLARGPPASVHHQQTARQLIVNWPSMIVNILSSIIMRERETACCFAAAPAGLQQSLYN